jgi:Secretion system C-terminal sorting domain
MGDTMYGKLAITLLGTLFFACLVSAQEISIAWENELDKPYIDDYAVTAWGNHGAAVAGVTNHLHPDTSIWIVSTSGYGDTLWTRDLHFSYPRGPKLASIFGGNLFIAASNFDLPDDDTDADPVMMVISEAGETLWTFSLEDEIIDQRVKAVSTHPNPNIDVLALVSWQQDNTWGYQVWSLDSQDGDYEIEFEYYADENTNLIPDELIITGYNEVSVFGREEVTQNNYRAFVHQISTWDGSLISETDWMWTSEYGSPVVTCYVDQTSIGMLFYHGFENSNSFAIIDFDSNILSTHPLTSVNAAYPYDIVQVHGGYLLSGVEPFLPMSTRLAFIDENTWESEWLDELPVLDFIALAETPGGAVMAGPSTDNGTWIGSVLVGLSVEDEPVTTPLSFNLSTIYPNPFNSTTTIRFDLARPSLMDLTVFDLLGREVTVLGDNQHYSPGTHRVVWDASGLSAGTYFLRAMTEDEQQMRRMVFLK